MIDYQNPYANIDDNYEERWEELTLRVRDFRNTLNQLTNMLEGTSLPSHQQFVDMMVHINRQASYLENLLEEEI